MPPPRPTRRTGVALPVMLAAVLEALDYMSSTVPAATGILDLQALVMQNIRSVEAARVIKEWKKAITMEEDNTDNINGKIMSKNIFGMAGHGATLHDLKHFLCFRRSRTRGLHQLMLQLPRKN